MMKREIAESQHSVSQGLNVNHAVGAVAFLRIMSSLAWLDSAFVGKDAKLALSFLSGAGLAKALTEKFVHTALTPGIANVLEYIVFPHAALFAWLIASGNLTAGLSLLLGVATRLGGVIAIMLAITNILVAGGAGTDTIGFNSMLIVTGLISIATGAGRQNGIDCYVIARWPSITSLRLIA